MLKISSSFTENFARKYKHCQQNPWHQKQRPPPFA
jgi:hypothetical protein